MPAGRFAVADRSRTVDVGYRGRPLPAYLGHGALEKHLIGERFAGMADGSGLRLDILGAEADRLYGDDWSASWPIAAACWGGVGRVGLRPGGRGALEYTELERAAGRSPWRIFESLTRWEAGSTTARSARGISRLPPSASAKCSSKALFGVLEPMVHYIPLKKDFSNLDEVTAG